MTHRTLKAVFDELDDHGVDLRGMVLKPNMVLSGKDAADRASADQVAMATVCCFETIVPAAVPGIAFLSGGQQDEESVVNLDAINRTGAARNAAWELTFSYGRGLQAAPLDAWRGDAARVPAAQDAFKQRLEACSAAREGRYRAGA